MTRGAESAGRLHRRLCADCPAAFDYCANEGIDRRLKAHFGLAPDAHEELAQALGVDFRGLETPYRGPKVHADIPGRGIVTDIWGIRRRRIEHASGGYWDYCDFPLREATEEEVAQWDSPTENVVAMYAAARDLGRYR